MTFKSDLHISGDISNGTQIGWFYWHGTRQYLIPTKATLLRHPVWFPLLIFANWVWVWYICALIWIAKHGYQYPWHYLSLHWLLDYFEVILKSLLHICNPIVKCSMANQEILWTGGSKEILWGRRQAINLTSKIWYFKWFREEKN